MIVVTATDRVSKSQTDRLKVEKNENAEYEKPFKTCRERKTTKRAVLEIVAVLLSQCLQ